MYVEEIQKRKQFAYPPYSRILMLHFRHKQREVVQEAANFFASMLQPKFGNYIVGPAEPVVNRVRNLYLMELMLKLPRDSKLIAMCKKYTLDAIVKLHADKQFKQEIVVPDVDPV
jgi:primosomal protein N' (replication factor Y)